MPRIVRGLLSCPKLADYFRQAFRPRRDWQVGIEVEKAGLHAAGGRPIPYDGAVASVRGILESYLATRGGEPVYEGEALIGLEGPWGSLSLEPGGQVEWSSHPAGDLARLRADLRAHLGVLEAAGRERGVRWLDVALQPDVPVAEMPWMPKARYAIMRRYLGERGRLAHSMMTQTTSIQCAFDFESDEDWATKFRVATLLAPLAVALFANSPRAEGGDTGWRSFRQAIWRETDPDRCGLPDVVFDPGFDIDAWVDWVCGVPAIFVGRGHGLVPSHGTTFQDLLSRSGCDAVTLDDWELHLSSIFTEVRSYTYIEVRSADLQVDPLIPAVPAFWAGLLYHPEASRAALEMSAAWDDPAAWRRAMDSAARRGLEGEIEGRPIRDLASRILGLAAWSLGNGASCAGPPDEATAPLRALALRHGLALREEGP